MPDSLLKGPLMPDDSTAFFVAEVGKKIIGLARTKFDKSRALLDSLVVHRDYRNSGIGFGLSQTQVNHALDKGYRHLKVLVENKPSAIKSYGDLGFKVGAEVPEFGIVEMELIK